MSENLGKIFQHRPPNATKFQENRPLEVSWSTLGTLLEPRCPKSDTKSKNTKTYSILGWPMGSKMEPKLIKNLIGNRLDFRNDFETTFSRYCVDFGCKNLSKMRGVRVVFSILLRICEKCDLERPSHRFSIFVELRMVGFRP